MTFILQETALNWEHGHDIRQETLTTVEMLPSEDCSAASSAFAICSNDGSTACLACSMIIPSLAQEPQSCGCGLSLSSRTPISRILPDKALMYIHCYPNLQTLPHTFLPFSIQVC